MAKDYEKKITWTIKNFSTLISEKIYSDQFVVGATKWHLRVYPNGNGDNIDKYLSLFLVVSDSMSLPSGWKRHIKYRLTVVNQISETLSQQKEGEDLFNDKAPSIGYTAMLPLSTLFDVKGGFLVNEEIKIAAEVSVLEVIGKSDLFEELSLVNESININGFQVLPSPVETVNNLFKEHPDIASNFRPKNPHLRAAYLNSLLSLIETLNQSTKELSIDDLTNAYSTLTDLTNLRFKLDWLELKLKDVAKTRVQEIEEELKELKEKCSHMEALLEFLPKLG